MLNHYTSTKNRNPMDKIAQTLKGAVKTALFLIGKDQKKSCFSKAFSFVKKVSDMGNFYLTLYYINDIILS